MSSLLDSDVGFGSLEVVVVDNGSVDGSLERLRREFAGTVRFIENGRNLGFAEACNRGMGDLATVDHVALVNNDAVVEPDCLSELVRVIESHPEAGAVAACMVLEPPFAVVPLEVRGRCAIERVEVDGIDATTRVQSESLILTGRPEWPLELRREAAGPLELLVPAGDGARVDVTLTGEGRVTVRSGAAVEEITLGPAPRTVTLAPDAERVEVLNGLGTDRTAEMEFYDRHFGELVDSAVLPELTADPLVVPGFCGGGVLLRAQMLTQVGRLDPRFFAYYEDSDLALRAGRAGWITLTAPGAVVRHAFGGSGGARAPGFFFLNYRNWLLAALRDPSPDERRRVRSSVIDRLHVAVRSNVLSPLRHGRRPSLVLVSSWIRVLAGYLVARLVSTAARSSPLGERPTRWVNLPLQPRFRPRPPGPRPGGPIVAYLEVNSVASGSVVGSGPTVEGVEPADVLRQLLVPPASVCDRLEVVPVVNDGRAARVATSAEIASLLGVPRSEVTEPAPLADLGAPRTVVLRVDSAGWSALGQGAELTCDGRWRTVGGEDALETSLDLEQFAAELCAFVETDMR